MFRWCFVLDVYVTNLLWFVNVFVALLVRGGIKLPQDACIREVTKLLKIFQHLAERSGKFTDDINVD